MLKKYKEKGLSVFIPLSYDAFSLTFFLSKNAIFPVLTIVTSFSNQAEYLHSTSNILSNYAQ